MRRTKTESTERGATVIEGALVLLVLFTFVFAIWEAGRMFNVQEVTTNAAREGARFAVAPLAGGTDTLPSVDDIKARVQLFLQASAITVSNDAIVVTRNFTLGGCDPATDPECDYYTRVTITVPYSFLTLPLLGDLTFNMTGQSTMRNETTPNDPGA